MLAFFKPQGKARPVGVFNILINSFTLKYTSLQRLILRQLFFILTLVASNLVPSVAASSTDSLVYTISIREEITPGMARKFSKAMQAAEQLKAQRIILHINTYGGLLDAADSIRTEILNSDIPVVAFIDNNAASAGALISIACNRIYMRSGASIGAATVVDDQARQLPDKYQSYMRSIMRSTAEKRGRDPLIAEAMVDDRTYIKGINDSGKVITFTTSEAIKNGYCEGVAESLDEVNSLEHTTHWRQVVYYPSFVDELISFLVNPMVSGILLLIMLGGIYFELQTPGIGFPLFAALVAALLYFGPLYIEGLAANWEILLAVAGFVLLAAEIFVIPGFGVAGISGIILLIVAFTFSMLGNKGFDFSGIPAGSVLNALGVVMVAMVAGIVLAFMSGSRLMKSKKFGKMVLSGTMQATEGYTSSATQMNDLVGREGKAFSTLRPSGKVMIDGIGYTANSESGFTTSGTKIVVTRFDGINLWVKEIS